MVLVTRAAGPAGAFCAGLWVTDPDKAIKAYPADHNPAWKTELGLDLPAGAFGENFTTFGLLETEA